MQVIRITLAVDAMDRMVAFYNESFRCGLEPIPRSPLYTGSFAGVELHMCPNSVAGVVAEQNRHQLRLAVADPERLAAAVVSAGGAVVNQSESHGQSVIGIADPEGNTMELVSE